MEIKVIDAGKPYTVAIIGRIDANTAPEFSEYSKDLVVRGYTDVVVDLEECSYVSSAGLRAIVALQKSVMPDGTLVIRGVGEEVMEVFDITGFNSFLTIEKAEPKSQVKIVDATAK